MKKIIGAFMGVSLLFVGISARGTQLESALHAAVSTAVQKAATPELSIYNFKNIFSSSEYMAFLEKQTLKIIQDEDGISLDKVKKNGLGGVQWGKLSAKEQERITNIANKSGYLREVDVMVILVLLDAQLEVNPETEKPAFHMDAKFSSSEYSGLVEAYPEELKGLTHKLLPLTRSQAREEARQKQIKEQALKNFYQKSQNIKWINADGTINKSELDKLLELSMSTQGVGGDGFETVIKDHVKSKKQDRGGGNTYIFDDGTILYYNTMYDKYHYCPTYPHFH